MCQVRGHFASRFNINLGTAIVFRSFPLEIDDSMGILQGTLTKTRLALFCDAVKSCSRLVGKPALLLFQVEEGQAASQAAFGIARE